MLSATDPEGRFVLLDQQTWDEHIVNRHPDVVPDWIQETIEEPDFITRDTIKRRKCFLKLCYYKQGILPRHYRRQYLKVVVQQQRRNSDHRVFTSHPAHHLKLSEEEVIWTRLTPSSSSEPT